MTTLLSRPGELIAPDCPQRQAHVTNQLIISRDHVEMVIKQFDEAAAVAAEAAAAAAEAAAEAAAAAAEEAEEAATAAAACASERWKSAGAAIMKEAISGVISVAVAVDGAADEGAAREGEAEGATEGGAVEGAVPTATEEISKIPQTPPPPSPLLPARRLMKVLISPNNNPVVWRGGGLDDH